MSTRDKVRVGIIGPSWWVDFWHLPAIQSHPFAEITGVCGTTARDEQEIKSKYGTGARYFTEATHMLQEAELDGVVVCTPNNLHYPLTMAALQSGRHVICEKPLAMDAPQAKEMADTAKQQRLLGMTNFPYRDNPCIQSLQKLAAEGYIGTLLHISGQYHGGFGLSRPPGWRGTRDRSGAGILGDLGSHLIDLARFVTGDEFTSVCAHSLTLLRENALENSVEHAKLMRTEDPRVGNRNDDSCAFLAEMQSGVQGIFHTSWVAYQGAETQHQELDLYGTKGRLHFLANHAGTFLRGKRSGKTHWEPLPVEGAVAPQEGQEENEDYFRPGRHTPTNTTYRWIEAIHQGAAHVSPDLMEGWHAQRVIDAVIAASRERRWVEVQK